MAQHHSLSKLNHFPRGLISYIGPSPRIIGFIRSVARWLVSKELAPKRFFCQYESFLLRRCELSQIRQMQPYYQRNVLLLQPIPLVTQQNLRNILLKTGYLKISKQLTEGIYNSAGFLIGLKIRAIKKLAVRKAGIALIAVI